MVKTRVGSRTDILSAIRERDFPRFVSILDERFKRAASRAARHTFVHKAAAEVLGSDEEARRWLREPAMDLNQQRPIDLIETEAGTQTVMDLLQQLHKQTDT
jgi:putative toxin-antitoxin system antitoxin component (TIGR02293 family)